MLTEIDIKATLKKKLAVDFDNYIILGACNPPFAYKALLAENIDLIMPCNVIVYEDKGKDLYCHRTANSDYKNVAKPKSGRPGSEG